MTTLLKIPQDIIYPETDGLPLSDNTKQLRLIMTTQGGLDSLFANDKVFVAGNLLWYPVPAPPGSKKAAPSKAPDVMVIFGQDRRDRTIYKQWEEGNLGPQVAFEFVSKNNSTDEVEVVKLNFYQKYGVDEYYIHDPDKGTLKGWTREGTWFQPIPDMNGWVSPLMGIRFELIGKDMQLYYPDGRPFETYPEIMKQREQERLRADREQSMRQQAESRADREQQLREQAENQLEQKDNQLERLRAQLRALGIDPDEFG